MAGFSLRKLFKGHHKHHHVTSKHSAPPAVLPTDPHSLALSRSLTSITTTRTKRRRGAHAHTPTLPPELILHIFTFAALAPKSGGAALQQIALLCKATNNWAGEQLYSSINLRSPRAINYCLRTLKRNSRLAGKVRSLTLDGWEENSARRDPKHCRRTVTGRLSHFLETCPHLIELEIKGAIIFSLTDFANAENLLSLTLTHTLLSDRTTTSRYHPFFTTLPRLHSLSLLSTTFDAPTAAHFLCPTTLPQLKVLNLDGLGLVDDPTTQRDLGGYEPALVASQLEYLRIGETSPREIQGGRGAAAAGTSRPPAEFVDKCDTLVGLSLPVGGVTESVLESLPRGLQHLEIRSPPSPNAAAEDGPDTVQQHLSAALALSTTFLALPSTTAPHTPSFSPPLSRTPSSSHLLSPSTSPAGLSALFPTPQHSSGNAEPIALERLTSLKLPAEWGDWEGVPSLSSSNLNLHSLGLNSSCTTTTQAQSQARARGYSLGNLSSSSAVLAQQARARGYSLGSGGRWNEGGGGEMAWALGRIGRTARGREIEVQFGRMRGELVGVGLPVGAGGREVASVGRRTAREVKEEWEGIKSGEGREEWW